MSRPWPRRAIAILFRVLGFIVALLLSYSVTALVLGAIPANLSWREAEQGVTIYLRTNGVHTWIMMPKINRYMDWRPYAPGEHLRDPRYGRGDHVAIGYGDREFYLNTPTWGDLTPGRAFHAAFGNGPPLLHVEHDHRPRPDEWQRPITISPDEYRRLAFYIRARFKRDANGRTIPVIGRGYHDWDMFYEANGGYSFVLTCNEWTGRALRAAGIRTGRWTPFAQSIMWRLD